MVTSEQSMEQWTEFEFQRVARTTRLNERSLEACKDVLVGGMVGAAACEKHKIFHSQLSRSLSLLREKREVVSQIVQSSAEKQQYLATEVGKALFGRGFHSDLAEPGKAYKGQVVAQTDGYLLQKVGRSGVLHDLANLKRVPALNVDVQIKYPREGGAAVVTEAPAPAKGAELGR
jgi:hypothetical protein